ncbi:SseB family protein [Dactylosporangium sp. NPDC000244]|uniref:SseB family protein n=1 Tax=Dactylosporangium sp. NPDC000244 TaxID=3154365 RepID=UPI00331EDD89
MTPSYDSGPAGAYGPHDDWRPPGTDDRRPSPGAGDWRPSPGADSPQPSPGAEDWRPSPGAGDPRPSPGADGPRPSIGGGDWRPSTEAEEAMAAAVAAGDQIAYLKALSDEALYLPITPAAAAGREPVTLATSPAGGTTYVLAWTSGPALPPEVQAVRRTPLFEVVHAIQERGWGIAVDPGLPVQAYLSPDAVQTLPPWEPEWWPLDDALRRAVLAEDREAYMAALLEAHLVLPLPTEEELAAANPQPDPDDPEAAYWTVVRTDRIVPSISRDVTDPEFPWWRAELVDGREIIFAFTSVAHMQAEVGDREWVSVPFVDIVVAWPENESESGPQSRPRTGASSGAGGWAASGSQSGAGSWSQTAPRGGSQGGATSGPALRLNPGGTNGMELPPEALAEMYKLFMAALHEKHTARDE